MELLAGKNENLSGKDVNAITDFLAKKLGFTGVDYRAVNGDWVITYEGREPVVPKTRKTKESTPSDPADAD
jgi:hypothetical protein